LGAAENIAPKAWEMAVKYQRLDAIVCLVHDAIFLSFIAAALWVAWRMSAAWDESERKWSRCICGGLGGVFIAAFLCSVVINIAQYLNAETCAAHAIMERVGK